jgi:hypothetical protein
MMAYATEHQFNDRLIRLPELEQIFGVCKRTVRRRGGERRVASVAADWPGSRECWKARSKRIFKS